MRMLMNKNISNSTKAGRLITVLGWATIFTTLPVLALIFKAQQMSTTKVVPENWLFAAFAVAVLYSISALVVGKNIKQQKDGAQVWGWLICLPSAICFIFGIPLGILAIYHLLKARSDPDQRS